MSGARIDWAVGTTLFILCDAEGVKEVGAGQESNLILDH